MVNGKVMGASLSPVIGCLCLCAPGLVLATTTFLSSPAQAACLLNGAVASNAGTPGNDTILCDAANDAAGALVNGGAGNDQIDLVGGTADRVQGASGNDAITLDGAMVVDVVAGGSGDDVIDLLSGTAAGVQGADDSDTITLNGAMITGFISGGDGDDVIDLFFGTADVVRGAGRADTITLAGADVAGLVFGDNGIGTDGDDRFVWTSGKTAGFMAGGGSDVATISASEYDGSQLLDGGDDGTSTDGFIDRLTFAGITADIDGGVPVNWEIVELADGSDITFTGNDLVTSSETGTDPISGLPYGLLIQEGAVARFASRFTVDGNVNNFGTLDLSSLNGTPDTVLTISGNYSAASNLIIDTVLGDDGSASDLLVVRGDTSGETNVTVNNAGGTGAQTMTGILVVDVNGASAGTFVLANPDTIAATGEAAVIAGAFSYALRQGDGTTMGDANNWYLQSTLIEEPAPANPAMPAAGTPLFQSGAPVYESLPGAMAALNGIPTLQQRVGNRYWARTGGLALAEDVFCSDAGWNIHCAATEQHAIWTRLEGAHARVEPASTTFTHQDINRWQLRSGLEGALWAGEAGRLFAGLNVAYGRADADIGSFFGSGSIDTTGWTVATNLTWYGPDGFFADAQAQYSWFDSDLMSAQQGLLAEGVDGTGHGLSLEIGQRYDLVEMLTLIPQAQLVWSSIDFDAFAGPSSERVSMGDGDTLEGRLGLAAEHASNWQAGDGTSSRAAIYGLANLRYDFLDGMSVIVSGTELNSEPDAWNGEIGLGGTLNWNDDQMSLYGEVSAATSLEHFGDSYALRGNLGFRVTW